MSALTFAPPVTVDGPLPKQPPYSLLSVAVEATAPRGADGSVDPHWAAGGSVRGYPPNLPQGHDPCSTGSTREKDVGEETLLGVFAAFTAYLAEICTARGVGDWPEFQRRANAALIARESFALERQLVKGSFLSSNPYLADTTLPNYAALGGAVSAHKGLELLEEAIGRTGQAGVIHVTPGTVAKLSTLGETFTTSGNSLLTKRGTPVAVGDGYIDQTPDGAAGLTGDQQWAWATGPVLYRHSDQLVLSPMLEREALDRGTNVLVYRAERDLFVAWDLQLQAAVLIDRSL